MLFKKIKYRSDEYEKMVQLRYRILREPLGLIFTREDLEKDRQDILLVGCYPKSEVLIGCCILSPIDEHTVQLRQMAIDDFCQGNGFGSQLLLFAEQVAREQHYKYMYLHARKVAVDFYKKHDYTIEGDQFIEVGIPHFEMLKHI